MTFRLSPGLYALSGELSAYETYQGSPIVTVGSFKKGSLTPTRIVTGVNEHLYDLHKTNLEFGHSTMVAASVAGSNDLVVKRVVSPEARSAEKSLMKYKNVSVYETLKYDENHAILEPAAIFITGQMLEDYMISVKMKTSDGFSFGWNKRFIGSHNETIKQLMQDMLQDLHEHNSSWQISYDTLADPIQAIFLWLPTGFSCTGTAEIYLDLEPLTLEEKTAVLDDYISQIKIALEDRTLLIGILSLETFYRVSEVQAFLDQWAKENYLSASIIADRINYYIAQIMLTQDAVNPFYTWLAGRQNILKRISQLDDLLELFKPIYYMTEQQIRDIIDSQVGVIITTASVDRVITDVFVPKNWLYSTRKQVLNELRAWAKIHLVTDDQKRSWVYQYIGQGKIRPQDFNEAFNYVSIPLDDTIALQARLDEYCTITYMTQAEKDAIIWAHVDQGDITAEDVPAIQALVSYLIRKDESFLIDEAISAYTDSKYMTLAQINAYVDQLISDKKLLQQDRQDFLNFLKNDPILTYYYKNVDQLDAKFDEYATINYITKAEAIDYVNSFVGTLINQSDADSILATIDTLYTRKSILDAAIQSKATGYFTNEELYAYVSQADIRPEDINTVYQLFEDELISKSDTQYLDDKINEWKDANYMNAADIISIVNRYNENQTDNPIVFLEADTQTFINSITEHILKGDDGRVVDLLTAWAESFYLSAKAIDDIWQMYVSDGQALATDLVAWQESTFYPPGGLFRNISEVTESLDAFLYSITSERIIEYVNNWRNYWTDWDYDLLTSITLFESDGTKDGIVETHDRMYIMGDWHGTNNKPTEYPEYYHYISFEEFIEDIESYATEHLEYENVYEMLETNPVWDNLANNQKIWLFNMIWYGTPTAPGNRDQHARWIYSTEEDCTSRINALIPDLPIAEWELVFKFVSRQAGYSLDFGDGQVTNFYIDGIDYMSEIGRLVVDGDGTDQRFAVPVEFKQGSSVGFIITKAAGDSEFPMFYIGNSTTPIVSGSVTIDSNTTIMIEIEPQSPYHEWVTKEDDNVVTREDEQIIFVQPVV